MPGQCNLLVVGAILLSSSSAAHAQSSCANGMAANMERMAAKAVQCGESADLMSSIKAGTSGRASLDELAASCQGGRSVTSQLSAFNECSRVYVCATLAYGYASEHLAEFGGNCTAAAQAGLAKFPIR